MCVYVHVCACIYMYVRVYTCMCVCVCVCVYIYIYMWVGGWVGRYTFPNIVIFLAHCYYIEQTSPIPPLINVVFISYRFNIVLGARG